MPPPPLTFTHPIQFGQDPLHNGQPQRRRNKQPTKGCTLGLYNIRDGHNSALAIAARSFQQGRYDVVIAVETKISNEIYPKTMLGYHITCSKASTNNQGGVALFVRDAPKEFHIESTRFHGPNVLSCILVQGDSRMPIVGAYLPPSTLDHLPDFEQAMERFSNYPNVTVLGDFNANIYDLANLRNQTIANCFSNYGLLDLLAHFKQRYRYRDHSTWFQVREGTLVKSRCDYILGTDRRLFEKVGL